LRNQENHPKNKIVVITGFSLSEASGVAPTPAMATGVTDRLSETGDNVKNSRRSCAIFAAVNPQLVMVAMSLDKRYLQNTPAVRTCVYQLCCARHITLHDLASAERS
jgi:hypothetical protein